MQQSRGSSRSRTRSMTRPQPMFAPQPQQQWQQPMFAQGQPPMTYFPAAPAQEAEAKPSPTGSKELFLNKRVSVRRNADNGGLEFVRRESKGPTINLNVSGTINHNVHHFNQGSGRGRSNSRADYNGGGGQGGGYGGGGQGGGQPPPYAAEQPPPAYRGVQPGGYGGSHPKAYNYDAGQQGGYGGGQPPALGGTMRSRSRSRTRHISSMPAPHGHLPQNIDPQLYARGQPQLPPLQPPQQQQRTVSSRSRSTTRSFSHKADRGRSTDRGSVYEVPAAMGPNRAIGPGRQVQYHPNAGVPYSSRHSERGRSASRGRGAQPERPGLQRAGTLVLNEQPVNMAQRGVPAPRVRSTSRHHQPLDQFVEPALQRGRSASRHRQPLDQFGAPTLPRGRSTSRHQQPLDQLAPPRVRSTGRQQPAHDLYAGGAPPQRVRSRSGVRSSPREQMIREQAQDGPTRQGYGSSRSSASTRGPERVRHTRVVEEHVQTQGKGRAPGMSRTAPQVVQVEAARNGYYREG